MRISLPSSFSCGTVLLTLLSAWGTRVIADLSAEEIVSQTPQCAMKCSIKILSTANCSLLDSAPCLCANVTLQSKLSTCVQQSCAFDDQKAAVHVQNQICQGYPQESRVTYIRIMSLLFFILTIVFLILRLISRHFTSHQLWADDWVALVAGILLVAGCAIELKACHLGFGKHYWNVPPENSAPLLKLFYALQVFYITIQVLAKISLLLMYARILPSCRFRIACFVGIAFVAAHGLAFVLTILFQCKPLGGIWNHNIPATCVNLAAVGFAGAAFSIIEDVIILIMPLPPLTRLRISWGKKVSLVLMFSIGSFACVTSMVRLKYLSSFVASYDTSWDNAEILVWSVLEIEITLICAHLPSLRPLILTHVPNMYKSVFSSKFSSRTDSDVKTPVPHHNSLNQTPSIELQDLKPISLGSADGMFLGTTIGADRRLWSMAWEKDDVSGNMKNTIRCKTETTIS